MEKLNIAEGEALWFIAFMATFNLVCSVRQLGCVWVKLEKFQLAQREVLCLIAFVVSL